MPANLTKFNLLAIVLLISDDRRFPPPHANSKKVPILCTQGYSMLIQKKITQN